MKKFIALALVLGSALPAAATPGRFTVVNPAEQMVTVPGLENLGLNRISTVRHCSELNGLQGDDWMELTTDAEFEGMEACLVEHT